LVSFYPPNAGGNLDEWEIRCPKWHGGYAGEYSCRLTDPYGSTHDFDYKEMVKLVRKEWQEFYRQQYLQEIGESEEQEKKTGEEKDRTEKIKTGVRLEERQYEKELGSYRPVGFRKSQQEFFICGACSKELKGAGHTGKAKNRNNPVFWGLEVEEKILCLECVKSKYYGVITESEQGRVLS
ncbi:1551_t:CDS:2, partial [Racocetra fulgida]